MKHLLAFILIIFIYGCGNPYPNDENKVLHEVEKVAVPEYYRKIIGYDSLQMIYFMGKWDVNFCNPNKWEFEKFKNKKVQSITFKYDSIMIINFDSSEVK